MLDLLHDELAIKLIDSTDLFTLAAFLFPQGKWLNMMSLQNSWRATPTSLSLWRNTGQAAGRIPAKFPVD